MNVLSYKGAEAVSLDGLQWDIYVRDTELVKDLENNHKILSSDVRYGHWSEVAGLKRGAIFPSDDFKRMEKEAAVLYEYLLKHHQDVPFTFCDDYELWLLDIMGQPLAILDSVVDADSMEYDMPIQWRAGVACAKDFSSRSFNALNKPQYCAAEYISHYVNQCAKPDPSAQWFHRQADGSGIGLSGVNLQKKYNDRQLTAKCFPKYFINDLAHDPQHSQLLNDYLEWQAPFFLLLQNLSAHRRAIIEKQAAKRALLLDELCHLFPDIVNETLINSARVEAVLRKNEMQMSVDDENLENINALRGIP